MRVLLDIYVPNTHVGIEQPLKQLLQVRDWLEVQSYRPNASTINTEYTIYDKSTDRIAGHGSLRVKTQKAGQVIELTAVGKPKQLDSIYKSLATYLNRLLHDPDNKDITTLLTSLH